MAKFTIENKVVYDSATHSLFRVDRRETQVTLAIPASLCLLALLQNKDETVSLEQLHSFAWQSRGMNVSTNAIYQNVSILRKALANTGLTGDIIKTVPKRGFVILSESFSAFDDIPDAEVEIPATPTEITPVIPESAFQREGVKRGSKQSRGLLFFLAVIMLSLLSFYGAYFFTGITNTHSAQYIYPDFTELRQDGDCHVYRNVSSVNDDFFYEVIKSHDLECNDKKWWYFFNYPPVSQTFLLRCTSDVLTAKNNDNIICSSDYYF